MDDFGLTEIARKGFLQFDETDELGFTPAVGNRLKNLGLVVWSNKPAKRIYNGFHMYRKKYVLTDKGREVLSQLKEQQTHE